MFCDFNPFQIFVIEVRFNEGFIMLGVFDGLLIYAQHLNTT